MCVSNCRFACMIDSALHPDRALGCCLGLSPPPFPPWCASVQGASQGKGAQVLFDAAAASSLVELPEYRTDGLQVGGARLPGDWHVFACGCAQILSAAQADAALTGHGHGLASCMLAFPVTEYRLHATTKLLSSFPLPFPLDGRWRCVCCSISPGWCRPTRAARMARPRPALPRRPWRAAC